MSDNPYTKAQNKAGKLASWLSIRRFKKENHRPPNSIGDVAWNHHEALVYARVFEKHMSAKYYCAIKIMSI